MGRQEQTELYGEPLGDLLGRIQTVLGLNQARIAKILGISAPMLSQLMSGQRTKIGNPAAVQRLQALADLSAEVTAGPPPTPEQLAGRLAEIGAQTGTLTTGVTTTGGRPNPGSAVRTVQGLLRAIAAADEVLAASALLRSEHPELAEFLRIYGAGRTSDALSHYADHEHLI